MKPITRNKISFIKMECHLNYSLVIVIIIVIIIIIVIVIVIVSVIVISKFSYLLGRISSQLPTSSITKEVSEVVVHQS